MNRKPGAGFTLIELLVTIAVFAILVAMAVPSFVDTVDRRRIIDASEGIAKQIQQARTIAIQTSRPITIVFDRSNAEWCFGLTDAPTCDCNVANDCQVPFSLDLTIIPADYETIVGTRAQYSGVAMSGAPARLRFEPRRGVRIDDLGNVVGTVESVVLTSARGLESRVMVNAIGRAATCSPAGSAKVTGMRDCP